LEGQDFAAIWWNILRHNPLVRSDIPVQVMIGPGPALQVQLITGQSLYFQNGSFSLE
jgi:hypothetical protein